MLRRADSIGSSGSLPNTSSNNPRMKKAYLPEADRPSPHSKQEISAMRGVVRFVGVQELAVDKPEDCAIAHVKQRHDDRSEHPELEAEHPRTCERRNHEQHRERRHETEEDAAQPRP